MRFPLVALTLVGTVSALSAAAAQPKRGHFLQQATYLKARGNANISFDHKDSMGRKMYDALKKKSKKLDLDIKVVISIGSGDGSIEADWSEKFQHCPMIPTDIDGKGMSRRLNALKLNEIESFLASINMEFDLNNDYSKVAVATFWGDGDLAGASEEKRPFWIGQALRNFRQLGVKLVLLEHYMDGEALTHKSGNYVVPYGREDVWSFFLPPSDDLKNFDELTYPKKEYNTMEEIEKIKACMTFFSEYLYRWYVGKGDIIAETLAHPADNVLASGRHSENELRDIGEFKQQCRDESRKMKQMIDHITKQLKKLKKAGPLTPEQKAAEQQAAGFQDLYLDALHREGSPDRLRREYWVLADLTSTFFINDTVFIQGTRTAFDGMTGLVQHRLANGNVAVGLPTGKLEFFNPENLTIYDKVESLAVGDEVVIHGLKSAPELNGEIGKIMQWFPDKGRFGVFGANLGRDGESDKIARGDFVSYTDSSALRVGVVRSREGEELFVAPLHGDEGVVLPVSEVSLGKRVKPANLYRNTRFAVGDFVLYEDDDLPRVGVVTAYDGEDLVVASLQGDEHDQGAATLPIADVTLVRPVKKLR